MILAPFPVSGMHWLYMTINLSKNVYFLKIKLFFFSLLILIKQLIYSSIYINNRLLKRNTFLISSHSKLNILLFAFEKPEVTNIISKIRI